MPKLNKQFYLEVTVEQFLEACSPLELQELELLLQRPRYRMKMKGIIKGSVPLMQNPPPPPPKNKRSPWDDDWDE